MPFKLKTLLKWCLPAKIYFWWILLCIPVWGNPPKEIRQIPQAHIQTYKSQKDFQYNQEKAKLIEKESWFNRIMRQFSELLEALFGEKGAIVIWKAVPYVIALIGLLYMLYAWQKAQFVSVLGADNVLQGYHFDQIRQMQALDFQQKIDEAIQAQNYTEALRWLYLRSLKKLEDEGLIKWRKEKTNQDYITELQQHPLQNEFKQLTYYFNYSNYGEMEIQAAEFPALYEAFNQFYTKQ